MIIAIVLCIFCTACSKEEISPAVDFRAELVQKDCHFIADIEADFGQTVQNFTLQCKTQEEELRFEVLEPESLSGITATVSDSGGTVTYDGMAMDFGLLANGNVIPAAAPAIIADCWKGAYISAVGREDDFYTVTYERDHDEKKLAVQTWFEKGLPISAEICYNQERVIKITIREF